MKYKISYTLKNAKKLGMGRELFRTKKEASTWLKKNSNKLYWHQLMENNPNSKLPKSIVMFEPGEEFTMKIGILQTHFETDMECLGLVFYEDGIHGPPNPNFDPSKPEDRSNFRNYAYYDAMTSISHGQILQIEDGDKIGLIKDRDFATRDGYRLSFYSQGFSRSELIELFGKENVKAKLWIPISKHDRDMKKFIRGPF